MASELIISTTPKKRRIILLSQGKIVEYDEEDQDGGYNVGDIYLGAVKRVMPGLNGVFVDIGHEKRAFLQYFDLGSQFYALQDFTYRNLPQKMAKQQRELLDKSLDKDGKITEVLRKEQKLLVKVAKESFSNKGVRVSSLLSIVGRYLILIPFASEINISKKIVSHKERLRLNRLITSLKPADFGITVRTAAEKKDVAQLDQDLKNLLVKWEEGIMKLRKAKVGTKIIEEEDRVTSILRDMHCSELDQIIVDDTSTYEKVKNYLQIVSPEKEKIIQFYQGKTSLFEHLGLERQIKHLFSSTVMLEEDGSYVIIQTTDAMHTIDVNSGSYVALKNDQENTALKVNLAAAREIPRLMRLRRMTGITLVDFISMRSLTHKRQIYEAVVEHAKEDKSKIEILPLTRFGLMQIARERTRSTTPVQVHETCLACKGSGKMEASILLADRIERQLDLLIRKYNVRGVTIFLHPYIYAYFAKGFFSKQWRWFLRYRRWIRLVQDEKLPITEYRFVNNKRKLVATNPKFTLFARKEE